MESYAAQIMQRTKPCIWNNLGLKNSHVLTAVVGKDWIVSLFPTSNSNYTLQNTPYNSNFQACYGQMPFIEMNQFPIISFDSAVRTYITYISYCHFLHEFRGFSFVNSISMKNAPPGFWFRVFLFCVCITVQISFIELEDVRDDSEHTNRNENPMEGGYERKESAKPSHTDGDSFELGEIPLLELDTSSRGKDFMLMCKHIQATDGGQTSGGNCKF